MITVTDTGTGWLVRVDGIVMGRGVDLFDALDIARRYGF